MDHVFIDEFSAQLFQNFLSIRFFEEYGRRYVVEVPDLSLWESFFKGRDDCFPLLPGRLGIAIKGFRSYFSENGLPSSVPGGEIQNRCQSELQEKVFC